MRALYKLWKPNSKGKEDEIKKLMVQIDRDLRDLEQLTEDANVAKEYNEQLVARVRGEEKTTRVGKMISRARVVRGLRQLYERHKEQLIKEEVMAAKEPVEEIGSITEEEFELLFSDMPDKEGAGIGDDTEVVRNIDELRQEIRGVIDRFVNLSGKQRLNKVVRCEYSGKQLANTIATLVDSVEKAQRGQLLVEALQLLVESDTELSPIDDDLSGARKIILRREKTLRSVAIEQLSVLIGSPSYSIETGYASTEDLLTVTRAKKELELLEETNADALTPDVVEGQRLKKIIQDEKFDENDYMITANKVDPSGEIKTQVVIQPSVRKIYENEQQAFHNRYVNVPFSRRKSLEKILPTITQDELRNQVQSLINAYKAYIKRTLAISSELRSAFFRKVDSEQERLSPEIALDSYRVVAEKLSTEALDDLSGRLDVLQAEHPHDEVPASEVIGAFINWQNEKEEAVISALKERVQKIKDQHAGILAVDKWLESGVHESWILRLQTEARDLVAVRFESLKDEFSLPIQSEIEKKAEEILKNEELLRNCHVLVRGEVYLQDRKGKLGAFLREIDMRIDWISDEGEKAKVLGDLDWLEGIKIKIRDRARELLYEDLDEEKQEEQFQGWVSDLPISLGAKVGVQEDENSFNEAYGEWFDQEIRPTVEGGIFTGRENDVTEVLKPLREYLLTLSTEDEDAASIGADTAVLSRAKERLQHELALLSLDPNTKEISDNSVARLSQNVYGPINKKISEKDLSRDNQREEAEVLQGHLEKMQEEVQKRYQELLLRDDEVMAILKPHIHLQQLFRARKERRLAKENRKGKPLLRFIVTSAFICAGLAGTAVCINSDGEEIEEDRIINPDWDRVTETLELDTGNPTVPFEQREVPKTATPTQTEVTTEVVATETATPAEEIEGGSEFVSTRYTLASANNSDFPDVFFLTRDEDRSTRITAVLPGSDSYEVWITKDGVEFRGDVTYRVDFADGENSETLEERKLERDSNHSNMLKTYLVN